MRSYKPYMPKTIGDIWDLLGSMMLGAPTFVDQTGYFPYRSIDTEFFSLKEGLKAVRAKLGEARYEALVVLADRMRVHFEADPEDNTQDTLAGRDLIHEMEDILRARPGRGPTTKPPSSAPKI